MADFTPHTKNDIKEMLSVIGAGSVEDLFKDIPAGLRPKSFSLPAGKTEFEAMSSLRALAKRNKVDCVSFLGGGYYDHFIPAAVNAVSGRAEFYTAYTPYQPEASQGTLRAIFEYQTMIANLTGLDYANASLYDGGTALYEAVAMAVRTNNRKKIIVDKGVNPLYRRIVSTYTINLDIETEEVDLKEIYTDKEKIKAAINPETSAVVVQNPNFFGIINDYADVFAEAKEKGAAAILCFYPLSLGILKTPGEMGADIAVGDGQSFGMDLSFGGPYLGVMAVNKKYVRKMPGRIAGETVDREGKKAYVLTLQAREQHIRREKATSNICSNQALCSLRAAVYLSLMGKEGLKETALINAEKAGALRDMLKGIKGVEIFEGTFFNEFAVKLPKGAGEFAGIMMEKGFAPGLPASVFYGGMENILIVAATEKRTGNEMTDFVKAFKEAAE